MSLLTFVAVLFPAVLFPVVCIQLNDREKVNRLLLCIAFAFFFGICGYLYKDPMQSPDIVRYIETARKYIGIPFWECFDKGGYGGLYALDIWFWMVAKTGNFQLIPAMSVFIVYFIQVYIITDYRDNYGDEHDNYILALLAIIFIIDFTSIVNGIRNYISFSIFSLAIYRDLVKKNLNLWTIILYIIPVFFHSAAYSLLLIRIVILIFRRFKNRHLFIVLLFPVYFKSILDFLLKVVHNNSIHKMLLRLQMYYDWDEGGYVTNLQNSFSARIMRYYFLAIVLGFLFLQLRKIEKDTFDTYSIIYLLLTLFSFTMSTAIYSRYILPFIAFGGIILMRNLQRDSSQDYFIKIGLSGLIMIGLFLNLHRINIFIGAPGYLTRIITFPISVIFGG